uniref:OBG-type G domain-containing protein n=1 Tax=Phaeomonas parva TaxID=124430 RepID=A0A6U4BXR3_9STRA|mmetsp:Transcript_10205/g.30431  ORF Transcript_10205/g.30431 Transcript_10205/m.30431 type:complete len:413 (+) Transcript_10205:163-1401(+)
MGILEKIKEIENEIARTQKNKATEGHLGLLKARLSKLRNQQQEGQNTGGGGGEGFNVARHGDGRVALIGFPSVGKSSLLSTLTGTESEAAAYEFTTLTCIPGNITYKDCRIQMLDLPGIIEGAAHGRGRGREVIAVARSADMVLMVLDGGREQVNNHRAILERELETVGIRLNQQPPDIVITKRATGGVRFNATVPLTRLGDDPQRSVQRILHEYKMHNCEVLCREDVTVDQVIDVIEGNRKYMPCLYCYNKVDMITIEDMDRLARQDNSVVISVHMSLNLDRLMAKIWRYLGLVRIFTKPKGQQPDLEEPVVLTSGRRGLSVSSAVQSISNELLTTFNYALVWGRSVKHQPQRVGKAHTLEDEDVLQIVGKTVAQQKHDKDYSKRVQQYNKDIARKRAEKTKAGKKKRMTG